MVRRKLGINRRPAAPPPPLPTAAPQILETPRMEYSLRIPHPWKVLRRSEVLLFAISHALQNPHHNNHLSTILFQAQIYLHPGSWRSRFRNARTLLAVKLSPATSLGQPLPQASSMLQNLQISNLQALIRILPPSLSRSPSLIPYPVPQPERPASPIPYSSPLTRPAHLPHLQPRKTWLVQAAESARSWSSAAPG